MRALRPFFAALAGTLLTLRLALPKIGVGWMFALLTSNFNQIAIVDLAVPAVIVTVMVGLHHFLSPFQVVFGRLADRHPVLGYRRTPYILLGSLLSSCVFVFLPAIAIGLSSGSLGATAAGYALLIVFGISIAMLGDAHHSLIAERVPEKRRGAVVGVGWTLMISSGIAGGIFLKLNLPQYNPATMQAIYSTTPLIVLGASLLGVLGVERRLNRLEQQATLERSRAVAPGTNAFAAAAHVLRTNAQARIFWGFVFTAILAIFLQDQILEVFGREVFRMTLQDAQGIQPVWGGGVLLGMLSMGLLSAFVPIGKKTIALLGSAGTALGMGMLALTALLEQQSLLTPTLLLMGFSTGLFNVGALSMMMDMTIEGATGLYMGMWGVAQAFGTGISSMLSGALKSSLIETGLVSPALGYTAIFGLETVLMVVAIALLSSVSVAEFRGFTRADVSRAMELGTA